MVMNVFACVGTHPAPFNRLVAALDEIDDKGIDILAQIGRSTYSVGSIRVFDFMAYEFLLEELKKADVVVCHGGAGLILDALKLKKKVIVVPRLARYGEHSNDHQKELADALERAGRVVVARDLSKLRDLIKAMVRFKGSFSSSRHDLVLAISGLI